MRSERAETRQLLKAIEEAGHKRFGQHVEFLVYCDTSDGDQNEYDACLHYVKRPPGAKSDILFPRNDKVITANTVINALQGLRNAIEKR